VRSLALAAVLVAGISRAAAAADPEERITLEDAVERAVLHGPSVEVAGGIPRVAEAERVAARAVLPEGLELDAGAATDLAGTGELRVDAALSVDLGGVARRARRVAVAAAALGAARAEASHLAVDVAAHAARAWVVLLHAERRAAVAADRVAAARTLGAAVERRLAHGDVSELERLEAALELAGAESEAALADAEVVGAAETLSALTGAAGTALRAAAPAAAPGAPFAKSVTELRVEALAAEALAKRADLQALRHAAEAAGARARLARSGAEPWPRLGVGVALDRLVLEPSAFRGDAALAASLGGAVDTGVLVGVKLVFPLAAGAPGRDAEVALAEARLLSARAALLGASIEAEVRAAYARAVAGERAAAAMATAGDAAARALALLTKAYDAGEIGVLELLAAKDRVFATRARAADAEAARLTTRIDLAAATGSTLREER